MAQQDDRQDLQITLQEVINMIDNTAQEEMMVDDSIQEEMMVDDGI